MRRNILCTDPRQSKMFLSRAGCSVLSPFRLNYHQNNGDKDYNMIV